MSVSEAPRVLVIGAGAVGSFDAAMLKRFGGSVSVVLRSDYDAVAADGFVIDSPLGDLSYRPEHVHHVDDIHSGSAQSAPDIILLCVKILSTGDRVALLRPWVGPPQRLALIANGIDIESALAAA